MRYPSESSRIAEDDRLRSLHIQNLVQDPTLVEAAPRTAAIPRLIVQFWDDPSAIPQDVRECLHSWDVLAGRGFERVLFDDNRARHFIAGQFGASYVEAFDRCRHPAMRCDYFRLCYILRNGGFYVDADDVYCGGDCGALADDDILKIQPLCYDVTTGTMVPSEVFAKSGVSSPDWIFYVNNNPLIAPAHHPVIRLALARATRRLSGHSKGRLDLQSTTGRSNLTASLVRHSITSAALGSDRDFVLLTHWETLAVSRWPLSYRQDHRNWRLWNSMA